MSDPLLPWYQRELEFFRQMSGDFSERFPKIAARLGLDAHGVSDPHVERLIQAVAYLNARIRYKIDDDFPEIADALLNVLYPHFLSPVPSCGIVQFTLDKTQVIAGGHALPRGTMLETEPVNGERCPFRTVFPVHAWPCSVTAAKYTPRPFVAPLTSRSRDAEALLHAELVTSDQKLPFAAMPISSLRFYLHAPQIEFALRLHKSLLADQIEVVLARSPSDPNPVILPPGAIRAVGFEEDDGLLQYGPRSFPGYRLLSEYFAFPRKFLFVDVAGWKAKDLADFGPRLHVFVYLKKNDEELQRAVSPDTLRLGCAPVVNLFQLTADAFKWDQRRTDYKIVPDARRVEGIEIYSVDGVRLLDQDGDERLARPFYSVGHGGSAGQELFWQATRRPGTFANDGILPRMGSDVYLSIVDLDSNPQMPREMTVHVECTCFSGDLPAQLPFGGGRPVFELAGGRGPLATLACLVPLSPPRRPLYKRGNLWKLLSHLSLNHYSLSGGERGTEALREIFALYDPISSIETALVMDGILNVKCGPAVARLPGPATSFVRGTDVRIELDEERFSGSGAYLFATVLDRFLAQYVTLNSFTRLNVVTRAQHQTREEWSWPARSGHRALL